MKNLDEKLVNIYELLGDYLEKAGYFEEEDVDDVKEETEENEENKDEKNKKNETYSEEEVQEILNRE